ncbi:MAG: hypothetical protein R2780_01895 [Crocinitomicaceae bacterium]|nr:hypothetical protein [Crocinitomicaceae bacterium]
MLRSLLIILLLFPIGLLAQEIPEDPGTALDNYINLREGYKHSGTKQFSRTEQLEMDDYCFAMQKKFPDAFETDLMWYINGHFYQERGEKISSAYAKAPSDKRVVKAMFGYYMLSGNKTKAATLASKVGGYFSANTLNYFEDVLPSSGVLIVSSEQEALPLYILQMVKGKGTGIQVVNMDYLINDEYRASVSKYLGTGTMEFFGSEASFIAKAMESSSVYVSTTVSQSYIPGTSFITGLYYQGSVSNQKSTLETFLKKVSVKNFASMSLTSSERKLYRNYLPPLLTLYRLKRNNGESDATLKSAILAIAKKVEQTKTVEEILKDYDSN